MKQKLLLPLLLSGAMPVYGQVNLSGMVPQSTDSLQKCKIRYFSPGRGGMNRVWDFSKKLGSKASSQVMFMKDSTGMVSVIETFKNSYYRTTPDTLLLLGSETALEKRAYVDDKISKRFPLVYGDSISMPFRCEGMYCGNHPFRELGVTTIKVDAMGAIVLAENDTVDHVRRVHTIDSYSICMDILSLVNDANKGLNKTGMQIVYRRTGSDVNSYDLDVVR